MNSFLYCYLISVLMSFLISLISFKFKYPVHLQLFSIFLGITVITEMIANFMLDTFNLTRNYPVYNCFILLQYPLLAYYFKLIITSKSTKYVISLFMIFFPLLWLLSIILIFGLNNWNSYAVMLGDLFVIIVGARYLYELFTSDELIDFKTSPEFWIAAALIFYCCCELPITGILNCLYGETGNSLLNKILQILNIIMYSTFIYAYLCRRMTNTTKSIFSS
jgi:hypothetical protein